METWKNHLIGRIEDAQHFLESKEISSYEAVKEFFKNVFVNFLNEVDNCKTGITEKIHEAYFYLDDMSMAIIDQGSDITIWNMNPNESKIMAILSFEDGHCFVKYVNPVKVVYLCEDEIEKIFEQVFLRAVQTH